MLGVIFDSNGTMFFDEDFQEISWKNYIRQKTGHDISHEEFQHCIHGRNSADSLEYFLGHPVSRDLMDAFEEEKEAIYRNLCLKSKDFKLADGLTDFLDLLKEHKIPMTIATASGWNNVKFFFEHLNLDHWFDIRNIVYNDGTIPGKPEPDLYLKAAEKLHTDIHQCVVFEDAFSGIESAKRAGAGKIIQVLSMKHSERYNHADCYISDYQDTENLMRQAELLPWLF